MTQGIEQELDRDQRLLAVTGVLQTGNEAVADQMVDADTVEMGERGERNIVTRVTLRKAEQPPCGGSSGGCPSGGGGSRI